MVKFSRIERLGRNVPKREARRVESERAEGKELTARRTVNCSAANKMQLKFSRAVSTFCNTRQEDAK